MTQATISHDQFDAVLFDMDGVVTRTAAVHFAAWKSVFDAFLQNREDPPYREFTKQNYLDYVDGKPREDGIRSFLQSRQIKLQEGSPNDAPGLATVSGLSKVKNEQFLQLIHTRGVEVYETTLALIKSLRAAGIKTALVTASKNGAEILKVTKLAPLFDAIVTGVEAAQLHLGGKPAPDVFLEAARQLEVSPRRTIVVEDAEAGVESGKNGHFGLVIGVARDSNTSSLKEHGANIVVSDLAELTVSRQQADSREDTPGMTMSDLDVTEANWVVRGGSGLSGQIFLS
jgi:alpha,alpha-trehalase